MARIVQLSLFDDEVEEIKRPTPKGGSTNPIVFHDYESYIAKFANQPKTTDDTYTPPTSTKPLWTMCKASTT